MKRFKEWSTRLAIVCTVLASSAVFAQAVPQRVRMQPDVAKKLLVKRVDPQYTPEMRRAHLQGLVKLSVEISKQGDVTSVRLNSGHPGLAQSAIDAVKQWKYKPFLLNGNPVIVETTVDINFSLAGS